MDGPTVEQVKAWAHELAGDVAALDVEQLHYYRGLSDRAWAVQLVRHVAGGGSLEDPLSFRYELEDRMRAVSSPDAPADEQEAQRASALLRLAHPHDENRMIDVLAAHGLAALDGEGTLPEGVIPLRRPKQAQGGDVRVSARGLCFGAGPLITSM
jgi:hypothetical protein